MPCSLGRWKVRIAYSVSCGAGDDHSLASDCCINHKHVSTSGISACGRTKMYIFACERVRVVKS